MDYNDTFSPLKIIKFTIKVILWNPYCINIYFLLLGNDNVHIKLMGWFIE